MNIRNNMNVQFSPAISKQQKISSTINNNSYLSPTFKGSESDNFVFENKEEKLETLFDKIRSYFLQKKPSDYINKSEAINTLLNAGFNKGSLNINNILDVTQEKKGYSKTAIENIIQIVKRTNNFDGMNIVNKCSIGIYRKGIDHNAQRAFLSTSLKMLDMGIPEEDISRIFQHIHTKGKEFSPEIADILIMDLPEEKDKSLLADFIILRFKIAIGESPNFFKIPNVIPDSKRFNAITDAYKTNERLHNHENFDKLIDQYSSVNYRGDKIELLLDMAKYSDPDDLCNINRVPDRATEILNYAKGLEETEKESYYKGVTSLSNKYLIDNFLNLHPRLKENGKDDEWLSKCIENCIHNNLYLIEPNLEYLREHFNDDDTEFYLKSFGHNSRGVDDEKFPIMKKYVELGANKEWLSYSLNNQAFPFNNILPPVDENDVENLVKEGVAQGHKPEFIIPSLQISKPEQRKTFLDLLEAADKQRTTLGSIKEPVSTCDIIYMLEKHNDYVMNAVDLIGKDTFIHLFNKNKDDVEEYIETLGDNLYNFNKMQPLIELINPEESTKVKSLKQIIKELKIELGYATDNTEHKKLIEEINKVSKSKNTIINNRIKDPEERIKATQIYLSLTKDLNNMYYYHYKTTDYTIANKMVKYLNPKTDEEKEIYKNKLNDFIWESMESDCPEKVKDKFNFTKTNYLEKMFVDDEDFRDNFKTLVDKVNSYSNESVKDALENMEINQKTRTMFEKYGLDYEKWTSVDPNLKLEITMQNNFEKNSKNAIKNVEKELSDTFFQTIPETEQKKMETAIEKAGFRLVHNSDVIYDENGFYQGSRKVNNLYKGDSPIEFKDLSKVIKAIINEFSSNEFWTKKNSNQSIEAAKETFKDHISSRHEEIKNIKQLTGPSSSNITIQKADMYNIPHSLFLGNDASCCTAVGSVNSWSAPQYIMHKFVQCIELKDGDKYIGNTMVYPALVNKKPALLLDNIELKPKYQYDENIKNGICKFAKMLTKEIGKPDMEIWAGPNRHKLDMKNFKLENATVSLIGETDENGIYADFKSEEYNTLDTYSNDFYKLY